MFNSLIKPNPNLVSVQVIRASPSKDKVSKLKSLIKILLLNKLF